MTSPRSESTEALEVGVPSRLTERTQYSLHCRQIVKIFLFVFSHYTGAIFAEEMRVLGNLGGNAKSFASIRLDLEVSGEAAQ